MTSDVQNVLIWSSKIPIKLIYKYTNINLKADVKEQMTRVELQPWIQEVAANSFCMCISNCKKRSINPTPDMFQQLGFWLISTSCSTCKHQFLVRKIKVWSWKCSVFQKWSSFFSLCTLKIQTTLEPISPFFSYQIHIFQALFVFIQSVLSSPVD